MRGQAIFEVSLILALLVGAFIAGAIVALIQDRKRLRRMHQQARSHTGRTDFSERLKPEPKLIESPEPK
jgi:uncharacterized integral membrane protein